MALVIEKISECFFFTENIFLCTLLFSLVMIVKDKCLDFGSEDSGKIHRENQRQKDFTVRSYMDANTYIFSASR
jgi:hypothetical protein